MKKLRPYLTTIVALIVLATSASVGNSMNIFKNDFEKRWEELSSDVKKLNEFTKTHPVELRNTKVEGKELDGVIFSAATFEGVEWVNTSLEDAKLTKTVFKNCKFLNTKNWNSTLTDVVFENCTFHSAEFGGSTMVNVRFKGCKITDSRLKELTGNELVIEESVLEERTSLAWSSIPMTFRKCTLDGVGLSGMKKPNTMTVEDSLLDEVDFGRGHFSTVTLRRVKQGEGPVRFNGCTIKGIKIVDVDLWRGLSLAEMTAEYVSIEGGRVKVAFAKSLIKEIHARKSELLQFSIRQSKMPYIFISDCDIDDFPLWDGFAKELQVHNSTINEIDGENFKADIVVWDKVTLDGKIDLTGAQVKDFRPTRLKRGSRLKLITTGSNLRF